MIYPAHILEKTGEIRVQTVEEHCVQCARYASLAAPAGLKRICYLAGLLHDLGKYTQAFRAYITAASQGEAVRRGSVNHTFAGARFILERWHGGFGPPLKGLTAEILAFAVGSHHGQFDCISPDGADGFLHRRETPGIHYREAFEGFQYNCASLNELDRLFEEALQEVEAAQIRLKPCSKNEYEMHFYIAMLSRAVLSAVIEGDRRDTAEFKQGNSSAGESEKQAPAWDVLLARVEKQVSAFPANEAIDCARHKISQLCRDAVHREGSVFRLNVPTGGGKTLSALRYALAKAADGKKRIFFVIPLLSILEQNASVIRAYLQEDSLLLEHHSNLLQEEAGEPQGEELSSTELMMENWRAGVVITTLVQLLNTLFEGKTSCIRRFNALCDSVIVIDEVQSVPRQMLSVFNLALNFLSEFCGATVVLCSATQPCLEKTCHALRYAPQPDLVPYDETLWAVFCRTELKDVRRPEGYTMEELAEFLIANQRAYGSVLLICNTKSQAKQLYRAVRERRQGPVLHLSTSMCPEHRLQTLGRITQALRLKKPVICIATQLVEAGVDFSFGCVVRILAGLDSVVQAAGRCNRSGEFGRLCPVYIVNLRGENLSRLPEIRQAQQAAEATLLRYQENPGLFANDPAGEAAIRAYYGDLYAEMKAESQDYPMLGTTLFQLLSKNKESRSHCATGNLYLLGQAFRTAGQEFQVFQDDTVDVLAPYGSGASLIAELSSEQSVWDMEHREELLRRASRFSVSLYAYERQKLQRGSWVYPLCGGELLALHPSCYSPETGLSPEGDINLFTEV